jgi:hypothetical protein
MQNIWESGNDKLNGGVGVDAVDDHDGEKAHGGGNVDAVAFALEASDRGDSVQTLAANDADARGSGARSEVERRDSVRARAQTC